jgi:hypothetical protein
MNQIEMEEHECPICYEAILPTANKCITQCGHTFCFKCILQCLKNNTNCPYCRVPIIEEVDEVNEVSDDEDEDEDEE